MHKRKNAGLLRRILPICANFKWCFYVALDNEVLPSLSIMLNNFSFHVFFKDEFQPFLIIKHMSTTLSLISSFTLQAYRNTNVAWYMSRTIILWVQRYIIAKGTSTFLFSYTYSDHYSVFTNSLRGQFQYARPVYSHFYYMSYATSVSSYFYLPKHSCISKIYVCN